MRNAAHSSDNVSFLISDGATLTLLGRTAVAASLFSPGGIAPLFTTVSSFRRNERTTS